MANHSKFKSEAFEAVHTSATALLKVGAIDKATMRDFDALRTADAEQDRTDSIAESGHERGLGPDEQALLFNAAIRALSAFGFSNFVFDIGGKKSRRRVAKAIWPNGEACGIWIKVAFLWVGMAHVLRFPWSKRAIQDDSLAAVLVAADDAMRRGCTHLLAVVGNPVSGQLDVAHLYSLEQVKRVAIEQKAVCKHPYYLDHGATLIVKAQHPAFSEAGLIANSLGVDVLALPADKLSERGPTLARPGYRYPRNPQVRAAVLTLARGVCERCKQRGFLTQAGEHYIETHHVVAVAERGPDTIDNIIALCANCHRQAHFSADRVQVEQDLLQALRRRNRSDLRDV